MVALMRGICSSLSPGHAGAIDERGNAAGAASSVTFTASEVEAGVWVCQFRGGDLSGNFSEDGLRFEASEILRWGSLEHPVTVQRHCTGRRL
jgi:hypothetical protein